jgi:hypothetical protein
MKPQTVYLVTRGQYCDSEIDRVYLDKAEAETYVAQQRRHFVQADPYGQQCACPVCDPCQERIMIESYPVSVNALVDVTADNWTHRSEGWPIASITAVRVRELVKVGDDILIDGSRCTVQAIELVTELPSGQSTSSSIGTTSERPGNQGRRMTYNFEVKPS